MKKLMLISLAVTIAVAFGSCRKAAQDSDDDEAPKDTTNYRLNLDGLNTPAEEIAVEQTDVKVVEDQSLVPQTSAPSQKPVQTSSSSPSAPAKPSQPAATQEQPKTQSQPEYDNTVHEMSCVEQQPSFPGGEGALYTWLASNITYPAVAAEEGVQGRVIVSFIVEKDGSISSSRVVRGKHPALDKEALRVVKKMPKWTPGKVNGSPVRVSYNLPVTFRLQ